MTATVPPPHTPDELMAAASFGPEAEHVMPAPIGVFCDVCGTTCLHDYVVRVDTTRAERFELARTHLRKHGWSCTPERDLCPDCKPA